MPHQHMHPLHMPNAHVGQASHYTQGNVQPLQLPVLGCTPYTCATRLPNMRATQRPTTTHSLASAACSFFGKTASMICFSSTMGYSSHILAAQERGKPLSSTVQVAQHAVLQSCGVCASSIVQIAAWLHQSLMAKNQGEPDIASPTSDAALNRRLDLVLGGHVLGCELLEHMPHRGSLTQRLLQLATAGC